MKANGHVFKYGDNVDTDVIIPARYLNSPDGNELAKHCMEDIDKEFVNKVQKGDIIVANKNFGCGSSREHAPLAIKCAGVSCVIAETFARIFYRNSINIGLPIIECPEAAKAIAAGDEVEVDFDSGVITDKTTGQSFQGQAFLVFLAQELISAVFDDFIEAVIIRAFQFDDLFPPFAPGQGSPAGIGREGRRTQGILDFLRRDPFFRIRDVPDQELLVAVDIKALAFHMDLGVTMRARIEE